MKHQSPQAADFPKTNLLHLVAGVALPGLGHLLQRRPRRAAVFAVCVWGLFAGGMVLSGGTAVDADHHEVYFLMQLVVGLPVWITHWGGLAAPPDIGVSVSLPAQMAGVTYLAAAGLCNGLAVIELIRHAGLSEGSIEAAATGQAAGVRS